MINVPDETRSAEATGRSFDPMATADPESLADVASDVLTAAAGALAGETGFRSAPELNAAMAALLTASLAMVPWVRSASIMVSAEQRAPTTIAVTDEAAELLDSLQYETGQGPGLDAITAADGEPVWTDNLAGDPRWPLLSERLGRQRPEPCGVLSSGLRLPLGLHGSLNFYTPNSTSFPAPARRGTGARLAAGSLAVSLGALSYRRRAENLSIALDSNRQIGAAVGVLMVRNRWTYEHAFDEMRRRSQLSHRKLGALADEVVLTGALPDS